jgi:hypothetical protein
MADDPILETIAASYIESAKADSFNGLVAAALLYIENNEVRLRSHLGQLVSDGRISCVFSRHDPNMHIKRFPDLPIERQLGLLESEALDHFTTYPLAGEIERRIDVSSWHDRPSPRRWSWAKRSWPSGLSAALERYRNDPRYLVHFSDYMGQMSIRDDAFGDENFPERDKVSLQTFGLGFRDELVPHLVVYLRYLSGLSPEHQRYWESFQVPDGVRMCPQYYQSSILGEFWKNRSIRYAIVKVWGSSTRCRRRSGEAPFSASWQ